MLVGDAAGAVSPLTAGGLDPCLRLSELAATEAAFTLLQTPPGRAAASRVLFGDGSFPDSRLSWGAAPA